MGKRKTPHDKTAERLASILGGDYNRREGPDIITDDRVTEVETRRTLGDAARQLQGFRRPVYIAPAEVKDLPAALERVQDTTIGVLHPHDARVVKRSTRGSKRRGRKR